MIIKTMIEGLARISEQLRLTVWDWWTASQLGAEVATPNKGDRERRTKIQSFSPEHTADLQVWFDVDRRALDPDFLSDPTRTKAERRAKAIRSPLFPTANGGFHTRSSVVDRWYRPAMKAAGLPTRTHYLRHAGVSSFLSHLRRREDLTPEQKKAVALQFAIDMGWKWPERMLEGYSAPERQIAKIEARKTWREERQKGLEALLSGLGSVEQDRRPEAANDMARSSIMRHILKEAA